MPAPADFTVTNVGPNSLTIQSQVIASGASYAVPFGSIVTWSKDPYLQAYVYGGQIKVNVLGTAYSIPSDILTLLARIAAAYIVFTA